MTGMRHLSLVAALLCATAPAANAGPAADAMAQCFVDSTNDGDRLILVQWIGTAIAAHPDVAPIMNVDTTAQGQLDLGLAALFERLMIDDCNAEIKAAVAAEGPDVFFQSGEILGKIAMQGLMTHPDVNTRIEAFASHLDQERIDGAFR